MLYDNCVAAAFLEGRPVTEEKHFCMLQEYKEAGPKRRNIVQELGSQLESVVGKFPAFNRELFEAVFPNCRKQLKTVYIMAVVNTKENRIMRSEEGLCILIDLVHIANYTHIVSQMTYILQNYPAFELSKYLIQKQFPARSRKYLSLLDRLALTSGFANCLTQNAFCSGYKFYAQKYEAYKERAFGLLSQALQVETKALQRKILVNVATQEFWNQFLFVAGMFYFDDVYRDLGKRGIILLYRHRPRNFIQTIFHE